MLNRRYLRVKVMQSLYTYEIAQKANVLLALQSIQDHFTPDWDQSQIAEEQAWKAKQKESQELFQKYYTQAHEVKEMNLDPLVREAFTEAMIYYENKLEEDKRQTKEKLKAHQKEIFDYFLKALLLPQEIAQLSENLREQAQRDLARKQSSRPMGNFKLARSPFIAHLHKISSLENEWIKRELNWEEEKSLIRQSFRPSLEGDPKYLEYDHSKEQSFEGDRDILIHLLKKIAFRQTVRNEYQVSEIKIPSSAWEELCRDIGFHRYQKDLQNRIPELVDSFFRQLEVEPPNPKALVKEIWHKTQLFIRKVQAELRDQSVSELSQKYAQETESSFSQEDENAFLIEQCTRRAIQECVQSISGILPEIAYDITDYQKVILVALDRSVFDFLEDLGLPNSPRNQISIQVFSEKKGSTLSEYFDSLDPQWEENQKIIQTLVQKFLKDRVSDEDPENVQLPELSVNWEVDEEYFLELFQNTLKHSADYEALILAKAENWELNRMALLDKVIIKMAIAEMVYCYSIPVKVSINEYIDLAKQYSTPKSKKFVNGLLDSISQELISQGKIKKSGRGLMDNK